MAARRISDIIDEIRREVRRLLADLEMDLELRRPMWDYETRSLEPLFTIKETEDEIIVTFDLPMVDKNNIRINATEEMLEVNARLREEIRIEGLRCVEEGTSFTCFRKVLRLPTKVDPTKARARFRAGILEIRLAKKVKKYRVEIE